MIAITQRANWLPFGMKTIQLVLLISTQVLPQVSLGAVPPTSHRIHEVSRPTVILTSAATAGSNEHDEEKQNSIGLNSNAFNEKEKSQLRSDEMNIQTNVGNYKSTFPSTGRTSTYSPIESTSKKQEIDDPIISTRKLEKIVIDVSEKIGSKRNIMTSTMKQMVTNLDTGKVSLMDAIRKLTPTLAAEETSSSAITDETITTVSSKTLGNVPAIDHSSEKPTSSATNAMGKFSSTSPTEERAPTSSKEETAPTSSKEETAPKSSTEETAMKSSTEETAMKSPTEETDPKSSTEETAPTSSTEETAPTSSTEETAPTSSTEETSVETNPTYATEPTSSTSKRAYTDIKNSTTKEEIFIDFGHSTTFTLKPKNKTTKETITESTELVSKTNHTPPRKYSHPSTSSLTSTPVSQESSDSSSFGIPSDKATYIPTSPATTKSYGSSYSWPSASLSTFIAEMQNKSADTHSTTPAKETKPTTASTTIAAEPRIDPIRETRGLSAGGVVGVVMAVLVTLTIMSGSAFALYRKKRTRAIDDAIHLMTARRGHNVRFYYDSTI